MTEQIDAAKWCAEILAEWDSLTQELLEVQFSDTSSSLLHKALVKRTQEKKAISGVKASAAAMMQQLMRDTDKGIITLDIPAIGPVLELTWQERLKSD